MPPRRLPRPRTAASDAQLTLDLGDAPTTPASAPEAQLEPELPAPPAPRAPNAARPARKRAPRRAAAAAEPASTAEVPAPAVTEEAAQPVVSAVPEAPQEKPSVAPLAGLLRRVNPRSLRAGEASDNYLYLVADADMAALLLSGAAPGADLLLGERAALPHLFERHAEEQAGRRAAEPVLLRVRRPAVSALLAEDHAASRIAGAPCYRLAVG